ncbi:MAG: hypothetical protein PWP40_106 [Rhodocyclaceae bacterium]|nr:hypothetical protein [Rhodocyclaceae bacterium]
MFEKSAADRYLAAVKVLTKAEAAHRKNLDLLYQAMDAKQAHQVTPLRRDCERSERALQDALQAAHDAHRAYWTQRRDAIRDELDRAALVIAEFDAFALLAGDRAPHPALRYLQGRALEGRTAANLLDQDVLATHGVPQEAPDSALLEDERGAWRP